MSAVHHTHTPSRDPFDELDHALAASREFSHLILAAVEERDAAAIERLSLDRADNSARIDALLAKTSEILTAQEARSLPPRLASSRRALGEDPRNTGPAMLEDCR